MMYQLDHPGRPVVVVGHSGGAAIAVWAAERMARGREIDGLILLSPALSPGYMLDWALENTRRGIVSFHSHRDWLLLGMGTTISGTMDGYHTSSAGRSGFRIPTAGGRPAVYDKLFQIGWQEKMQDAGSRGGHLSIARERFVAAYVAPFALADDWDERFVARVLNRELGRGPPPAASADRPAQPHAR